MLCDDGAVRCGAVVEQDWRVHVVVIALSGKRKELLAAQVVRSQPAASEVPFPANRDRDREQHCCNCTCNCNRSCTHHTGCTCAAALHSVITCTVRIHCSSALQVVLVYGPVAAWWGPGHVLQPGRPALQRLVVWVRYAAMSDPLRKERS